MERKRSSDGRMKRERGIVKGKVGRKGRVTKEGKEWTDGKGSSNGEINHGRHLKPSPPFLVSGSG